ncbi:MAG: acetyl-CoA carboxylase biotin carboxyl carrier protein subunit, partial [Alphaproteobacteria bacterium]
GEAVTVFDPAAGPIRFDLPDPLDRGGDEAGSEDVVRAPMPGLVRAVLVAPGDEVVAGQRLAVLEAMKMEHALSAGRAGRVAEVLVAPGAQVAAGDALIRLEAEGEGGPAREDAA